MENIDKIRMKAITKIKENVNKNPRYLHPCNKERLEDMKRLMFASGNEFTQWMQNNGIMKSPTDIKRKEWKKMLDNAGCKTTIEYLDKCAQYAGFKDSAERKREWKYETGRQLPAEVNEDCPIHFGEFTEKLMIHYYPGAKKMPQNNPGFDFLWIDENGKEVKIDNKGGCLDYSGRSNPILKFLIRYNNIADRFILSAWDNRVDLNPLFALEFKKNDLVRHGQGDNTPKIEFWKRVGIGITYPEGLEKFKDHLIDIGLLKTLCEK